MRMPRVRITVGRLLFAIAIFAANCGLMRALEPRLSYGSTLYGEAFGTSVNVSIVCGFLPLANVVIFGTLLVLARMSASLRHRESATQAHSHRSGFLFLCIHFLAVGCVVWIFMSDRITSYLNLFDPSFERVVKSLSRGTADAGTSANNIRFSTPYAILVGAVDGVVVSGPLLLLAWVGGMLAKRSSATLPRPRFATMAALVSFGFAGVAFTVAETVQPFDDSQKVAIDLQIIDAESGAPIHGAFVLIRDAFDRDDDFSSILGVDEVYDDSGPMRPRALTGPDGLARLTDTFYVRGERTAFRSMGTFVPDGRWLEVSAAGHQAVRVPLTNVIGLVSDLEQRLPRKVAMLRGETPAGPFRDVAGVYSSFSFQFKIEPDGRYSRHTWGGCSRSRNLREYGYLTKQDGELVLAPILRPGEDPNFMRPSNYRTIPWGDLLYLCEMDEMDIRFACQVAIHAIRNPTSHSKKSPKSLIPDYFEYSRTSDIPAYFGYLRTSDRDKPHVGVPQIPAILWVRFALSEINPRNEYGSLRKALSRFLPKTAPELLIPPVPGIAAIGQAGNPF